MEPSGSATNNITSPGSQGPETDDDETTLKHLDARRRQSRQRPLAQDEDGSNSATNTNGTNDENGKTVLECPICLQSCQFPVQLPCRHIFCFLCVKGVVSRNKGCALCRQSIPSDYLYKPTLLYQELLEETISFDDGYGWFYEGTEGWWQYDDRTSKELEIYHKAGSASCEFLIAGFVYVIDLTNMVQYRRNDRSKRRRVKRDLISIQGRKGVAGLKILTDNAVSANDRPGADGHETNGTTGHQQSIPIRHANQPAADSSCSPPTPHNTPQTPMTPSESPPTRGPTECDLSGPLQRLRLTAGYPPSPPSPQVGAAGSSPDFHSSDFSSPSMEDVRASLQQLQSASGATNHQDSFDAADDGNV